MAYTTIDKPSSYFNTVTYTGDGTTNQTRAITFGFKPDWAWFKARDAGQSHIFVDSVRGGTKYLVSESSNAEGTLGVAQLFTSTGMTISNDASANSLNSNGSAKVSWGWLGSNTTTANTSGSISSTVSVNQTAGFSVVSYTGNATAGATVGHGLGAKPAMIIFKNRIDSSSAKWAVYHQAAFVSQADPNILYLDDTAATADDTNVLGNSTVTLNSNVFSLGDYNGSNGSGDAMIAYCFSEVKGYSKFGSYTGNGSADGTFVYTGFKPAFVLWKVSSTVEGWYLVDNKRDTYNVSGNYLLPNTSAAESGANSILDLLSNGFKFRSSGGAWWNGSGATYIYMAFAENPFVTSGGIPVTAR